MKKESYMHETFSFIRNKIVLLIPGNSWLYKRLSICSKRLRYPKRRKKRDVMRIGIAVVEHCNLCCRGCNAFAPLAQEEFLDYEQYCKDMYKLAELTNHNLSHITFTGGEPLLHPQLGEMIKFAYELFPESEIKFITNGVLIPQQKAEFWKICSECNVKVHISRYPIKLDDKKIDEIKERWKVDFDWAGGKDAPIKKMWKEPIDLTGKASLWNSFKICPQVNYCMRMKNGKIYPCSIAACIEHFNEYFNKNIKLIPGKDFLELNKVKDIQEIFEFLTTPPHLCRYCNRAGFTLGYDWEVSKKDISEWT